MNCPRDNSLLEPKPMHDLTVETCPTCGGMYLEHGQLNRIVPPTQGDVEFCTVDGDTFQHEDEYGPIACPHDATTMRKVDFNIDTQIVLDYCPTCHGFWIDPKELDRMTEEVKRLNEAGEEVPDPLLVRISQFFWNMPLPR